MIAALGHLGAQRTRLDGEAELVELNAAIVDVELARNLGTCGLEHPRQRVADGSPARVAEVQRTGRVRRDELNVEARADEAFDAAVGRSGHDDRARELAERSGIEGDVEESGAGDVDLLDSTDLTKSPCDGLGHDPRCHPCRLRELEGDVGRVVAVLGVSRALDRDLVRDLVGREGERLLGNRDRDGVPDRGRELLGSHAREPIGAGPAR